MNPKSRIAGRIIFIITFLTFSGFFAMTIAPKEKVNETIGIRISHIEETDGKADTPHLVIAHVFFETDDSVRVSLHYYRNNVFTEITMSNLAGTHYYGAEVPGDKLGERSYYYIEASILSGGRVVLPATADDTFDNEYDYFKIRYEGKASFILLLLHIVLMITALFFLIHALYYAMNFLLTGERIEAIVRSVNLGTISFFIAGFPIGCIIEKQVIGNYWEGIPFGWDITDSKTLIILVLWSVFIFLKGKGIISDKAYASWVIINTIITIGLFLLPHSI